MKNLYKPGDKKYYQRTVRKEDVAAFESGEVHPVYSTFALARDAEWTCRLFALDMKEDDEEGIGTFITVNHHAPVMVSETVNFEATLESVAGNEIVCGYKAEAGGRMIATGRQGQKILKKTKIESLFENLKHG